MKPERATGRSDALLACPLGWVPLAVMLWLAAAVVLAGCWRSSPPQVAEFKPPPPLATQEAPATQLVAEASGAALEPPKPEPEPEATSVPVAAAPATPPPAPPPPPVEKPVAGPTIIGTWRVISATRSGQAMPMPPGAEMLWTFGEDGTLRMQSSFGGQEHTQEGSYTLSGDQISITMRSESKSGTVTFSGTDSVTLTIEEMQFTLARA